MKRISSKGSLDALRALPLFSALPEEEFADLVSRCVRQRHAGGEEIFAPGDEADRFFVILSGTVKVFQLSAKGDEQILHLYGAGQTFGEAAMWSQVPYPAYAIALDETWLLVVSRAELQSFIEHRPELAMAMLAGLSTKLREFNRLIEHLALKEVPGRLAQVLLDMAEESGQETIRLRQTKRELAAQIGTVSETLSRAFKKLAQQGLINVDGSRITILDPDGLEDVAQG